MTDGTHRVLIVEDHNDVADIEKLLCEMEGYEVMVAKTGQEGWDAVESFAPDLVVLDIMLPGTLSGHDVLQRIRTHTNRPKVLVVSALMNEKTAAGLHEPGLVETMEKPFTVDTLAHRIRTLFGVSPSRP